MVRNTAIMLCDIDILVRLEVALEIHLKCLEIHIHVQKTGLCCVPGLSIYIRGPLEQRSYAYIYIYIINTPHIAQLARI